MSDRIGVGYGFDGDTAAEYEAWLAHLEREHRLQADEEDARFTRFGGIGSVELQLAEAA